LRFFCAEITGIDGLEMLRAMFSVRDTSAETSPTQLFLKTIRRNRGTLLTTPFWQSNAFVRYSGNVRKSR
jgi:hypothetical protein